MPNSNKRTLDVAEYPQVLSNPTRRWYPTPPFTCSIDSLAGAKILRLGDAPDVRDPTRLHFSDFVPRPFDAMPLFNLTPEQQTAGLNVLEPEFLALLESKKVRMEVRAVAGHLGLVRLATFAHLETDEMKFRELLKEEFGLDGGEGMRARIDIAALVESWRTARQRIQVADEAAAEARAHGRPLEVMAPQANSLRKAHGLQYGKVEDSEFPSRDYLAWRFAQFEENEYRAEPLTDVVNMVAAGDDRGDPSYTMLLTTAGKVAGVRQRVKVDLPQNPEQLRRAYRLMATHWEVVRQVFPDRPNIAHSSSSTWEKLVTFLLGPKVWEYKSRHGVGISWAGLLEYEFQIRKHAMTMMTDDGASLDDALRTAWRDPTLENRFFTLEIVTSGEKGGGGHRTSAGGEGKGGNKRAMDRELAEVKKLRAQLANVVSGVSHQGGGKGKTGPLALTNVPAPSQSGSSNDGGRGTHTISKLNGMRKLEQILNRAKGSAVIICNFYNIGQCKFGTNCKFDHLCLRCHQPGHAIMECKETPRSKTSK